MALGCARAAGTESADDDEGFEPDGATGAGVGGAVGATGAGGAGPGVVATGAGVGGAAAISAASAVASSSSTGGCVLGDVLADGDLEAGTPSTVWTESSTNFGTPICDVNCGMGGGSGPQGGTYWAWFGGVNIDSLAGPLSTLPEVGSITQSVAIPAGTASLEFMLELPVCDSQLDSLSVRIDGQQLYSVDGSDAQCGIVGYQLHTVDLSAYADGASHTVIFEGVNQGSSGATNFMVDDIKLFACQ